MTARTAKLPATSKINAATARISNRSQIAAAETKPARFTNRERYRILTLPLPTSVHDSKTQMCLDEIASRFPLGSENLRAVILRKVAELPESGEEGEMIYNEATKAPYYFNGTEWVKF